MDIPFLRIETDAVQEPALNMITVRMAENHGYIPIRIENEKLVVAMQNPMNLIAIEDIERIGDYPVEPVMSTPSDIKDAIDFHYHGKQSAP